MGTTAGGLPYPEPSDPIASGADAIRSLAETIDPTLTGKLAKAGGTMTGPLVLAADPAANLEAATKQYVDNLISRATITPTAGWVTPGGYVLNCVKSGKIVVVNFTLRNSTGSVSAANPVIGTVPAGYRPAGIVKTSVFVLGMSTPAAVQMTPTGNLQMVVASVAVSADCSGVLVYEQAA